jgi:hypothetical protein
MIWITLAALMGLTSAAALGRPLKGPALAVFIMEGSADDAQAVDPDGRVRRRVEDETTATFRTRHVRMMTRAEMTAAASRHPDEFRDGESALEGARALRADLVFALSFRKGLFFSGAVLNFGLAKEQKPRIRLELAGSSQAALLADWASKQGQFIDSAKTAAEAMARRDSEH